jgi:hypothetical protein
MPSGPVFVPNIVEAMVLNPAKAPEAGALLAIKACIQNAGLYTAKRSAKSCAEMLIGGDRAAARHTCICITCAARVRVRRHSCTGSKDDWRERNADTKVKRNVSQDLVSGKFEDVAQLRQRDGEPEPYKETEGQREIATPLEKGRNLGAEIHPRDRGAGAEVVAPDAVRVENIAPASESAVPDRGRGAPKQRVRSAGPRGGPCLRRGAATPHLEYGLFSVLQGKPSGVRDAELPGRSKRFGRNRLSREVALAEFTEICIRNGNKTSVSEIESFDTIKT